MYAVVRLAGEQVFVKPDDIIEVPKLDVVEGSTIRCEDVLLFSDGKDVKVGRPLVDGVSVLAEVLEHGKARKVIVFKMKRRKNYRRKNGHRQGFTRLKIKEISA
ncbi:MAG: 50S ribosomal protein L21 [Candidatus Latescibacteria bacterium 4484_7]|nr:MAG: 50S ribosomal protein L21 [Candidatus Latescibacteria bacterium 4484_7]